MTRAQVKALHAKLNAAMEEFAADNDLTYISGNGRYDATSVTFKIGFAESNGDGVALTKEATDFDHYKGWNGLADANVGDYFETNGKTFQILGWRSRARKRPVLTRCSEDGKQYVFPASVVAKNLR